MAVLHFLAACAMVAFANWVGLRKWHAAQTAHWTERARLLWPARTAAASNLIVVPAILLLAHKLFFPDVVHHWVVNGIAALVGAVLGSYPFDRAVFPQLDFKGWRRQAMVMMGFRLGVWAVLIAAVVLMPEEFGWGTAIVAGSYLVLHFAVQFGLLLRYFRWTRVLTPANQRLQRIVADASASVGVRVRATGLLETVQAQAFAFPTTNELLFTGPLLEICDDEELSAVTLHELAHLSESKFTLAGRLIGSLSVFPAIFAFPLVHLFGAVGILAILGAFFSIQKFSQRLSHKMENRADHAAISKQSNEGVYARALCKLYLQNQLPAVNPSDRATHPHLYDRMLGAGITPDFDRPAKPQKTTWIGTAYTVTMSLLLVAVLMRLME